MCRRVKRGVWSTARWEAARLTLTGARRLSPEECFYLPSTCRQSGCRQHPPPSPPSPPPHPNLPPLLLDSELHSRQRAKRKEKRNDYFMLLLSKKFPPSAVPFSSINKADSAPPSALESMLNDWRDLKWLQQFPLCSWLNVSRLKFPLSLFFSFFLRSC